MRVKSLILAVFAIFLCVRCGQDVGSQDPKLVQTYKLGNQEYKIVQNGDLTQTDSSVSGRGRLLFAEPMDGEDIHLTVKAEIKDQGSLQIVAKSDNTLAGGATLMLYRDGNKLIGSVARLDETPRDVSASLAYIDVTKPFTLELDVHSHGHFWLTEAPKDPALEFEPELNPALKGWGFHLKDATIFSADLSPAQIDG